MSYDVSLPGYTVGEDAYKHVDRICSPYGKKAVVIGGKKAMAALSEKLNCAMQDSFVRIIDYVWYGGEASYENVEMLTKNSAVTEADMIFAAGGGKATDTVKTLAFMIHKPVFTFPTIASNCSACTSVSIMYRDDGVFLKPHFFEKPPVHAFIDTEIIAASPVKYMWAGIGDTYAKYFESEISSRDEEVTHYVALGVNTARMCYEPMMKYGLLALSDMENKKATKAFEQVLLSIIVTTAIASILLTNDKIIDYNTGLAHAIFYALTSYEEIEKNHLHGEVVSFGILVLLLVDNNEKDFDRVYEFNKKAGLPLKLKDIGIDSDDIGKVAKMAAQMKDIDHNPPYRITEDMIEKALNKLENM